MHKHEPPRLSLANLPTPLLELKNLARHLGIPRIVLKRDDLTGLELSGNKVRKLEYLLADALAKGAISVVTHGGFQSNHCRATAAACARLGLHCRLVLRAPATGKADLAGNLFLDHLFGATVSLHPPAEYKDNLKPLLDAAIAEEEAGGRHPYFFPVGASTPLGAWGYIRCIHELSEQLGQDTSVDIFSVVSSAGTHAGLMLGRALFGLNRWRVVGIPVSDSVPYFEKEIRILTTQTSTQFGLNLSEDQMPLELLDGSIGEGYAIPTPQAISTTGTVARLEGILLDPTYTAKAFAGFLHAAQTGQVRKNAVPLFLHTGGVFGLLARTDFFPT